VSTKGLRFIYPYCYRGVGTVAITSSRNNWQEESNYLSYFDGSVPIEGQYYSKLRGTNKNLLKSVLKEILINPQGLEAEFELTDILFKNKTLLYESSGSSLRKKLICDTRSPTLANHKRVVEFFPPHGQIEFDTALEIEYKSANPNAIASSGDHFTFICCGVQNRENLNFHALFKAFDGATTSLIVISLMIWPLLFCLLVNSFNIRKVISDVDGLVLGVLLEQGHRRIINSKGRNALYILAANNLLVSIVISNAFKGNNIQSVLSDSELNLIPYPHFDQFVDNSFEIFSQIVFKTYDPLSLGIPYKFHTELEEAWEAYGYQHNETKLFGIKARLKDSVDFGWGPKPSHVSLKKVFGKCNKSAIVGWKFYLKVIEKELRGFKNVFLGKENIFRKKIGIKMSPKQFNCFLRSRKKQP